MNKLKKKEKGITLIALIVTIVVTITMTGVILNATVGTNGIITRAQLATYEQSRVVLQEYLNNFYIEHWQKFEKFQNKALALKAFNESSSWFYQEAPLGYIVDEDGNAHYFINKSGLPDEIREQIKGGDAKKGRYIDYANLIDVYGVTHDLKVYYCKNGKNSIIGLTEEQLDFPNSADAVFENGSEWNKIIAGDKNSVVTLEDIKSLRTLTIDASSDITSLNQLSVLISLQELTIEGLTLENLEGIEKCINLKKIYFKGVKIQDYSKLNLVEGLTQIYFLFPSKFKEPQKEVDKIFDEETGIINGNFANLQNFGIFGYDLTTTPTSTNSYRSSITNLSGMNKLSLQTKQAIQNLYINNNSITNVDFLTDFTSLSLLHCKTNKIANFAGLANSNQISKIYASYNSLGINEDEFTRNADTDALASLANKTTLKYVDLGYNTDLKWCGYIENSTKITTLHLRTNENLIDSDVVKLRNIYNAISPSSRSIPDKYLTLFSTDARKNYANKDLTDTSTEILGLTNNKDVIELCLSGNTKLTNETLNEILSTCTNIKTLSLRNITNLTNIDFVNHMPNLLELDLIGTSVTDLSALENISTMENLYLSNENTDLSKIQKTIDRLGDKTNKATFTSYPSRGLIISNEKLIPKLKDCKNISRLIMSYQTDSFSKITTVDLSECLNLKTIEIKNCRAYFTLSPSVTKAAFVQSSALYPANLALAYNLKELRFGHCISLTLDQSKEWFSQISNCINLEKLEMYETKFVSLEGISELAKCTKLKTLNAQDHTYNHNIGSLKGLGELTTLTSLNLGNRNINDITELSTLVNLTTLKVDKNNISDIFPLKDMSQLTNLNLSNNDISSLKYLEGLTKLETLDLSGNLIYDTSAYVNQIGEKIEYDNLEIIAKLNQNNNGNLKDIYLSNNIGITDFSPISNLTWRKKNGF